MSRDQIPLRCNLTPHELDQRMSEWDAVRADAREVSTTPGGTRFTMPGHQLAAVERLVALEAQCCSHLSISISEVHGTGVDAEFVLEIS